MSVARFKVVHAGPHCSVQDAGRPGNMRFGVPASGPMDRLAFDAAHAAIGNPQGGALIEVSMGGLTLECTEGAVGFAVAGGGFKVTLDRETLGPWCVASMVAGQTLTIRPGEWGSWACLAFGGTLEVETWLGSAATHAQSGFGGGAITSGQVVTVAGAERRDGRATAIEPPTFARPGAKVPVVPGPQDRFFAPETLAALTSETFRIGDAYDRMGVRLSGVALPVAGSLDMPSEPVLKGSVQVSGDGTPTVLLADHQTTGGYPKIATVPGHALDAFCQSRSGDAVRFVAVTPEAALKQARADHDRRAAFLGALAEAPGSLADRLARANLIDGVTDGGD
ncbi:biotin-dependent carboxyltransferase family protein [Oceaniglobus indicus]|uniref:5-oxoprolinase subunit C family protein n=1 Tax=Oceaniglobus indicus TaxID=2047749 RepID=UPI000C1993CA|nr:biotin-dependent carboxyltransferase family protein [Oceaniglobus indicus]